MAKSKSSKPARFKLAMSRFIYTLAIIDFSLVSIFFYRISKLDEQALQATGYIAVSFWVDYIGWIILAILVPCYVHHGRYELKAEATKLYDIKHELHARIFMVVGGDFLPAMCMIVMFVHGLSWVFFGSGPNQ